MFGVFFDFVLGIFFKGLIGRFGLENYVCKAEGSIVEEYKTYKQIFGEMEI